MRDHRMMSAQLRELLLTPEEAAALDAPGSTDAAVLVPLYLARTRSWPSSPSGGPT